jgi:glycosyltransferase involved in cell wall biosynthesis
MKTGRVQFWGPLPPLRTGVADYNTSLLEQLAATCNVELVVDVGYAPELPRGVERVRRVSEVGIDAVADPEVVRVYQMGNNARYHGFMYPHMVNTPGVVVLHDVVLIKFHKTYFERRGGVRRFLEELDYAEGRDAATRLLSGLRRPGAVIDFTATPMLRRIVETSRSIIVHSGWAHDYILARHSAADVRTVPHGTNVDDAASWRRTESADAFVAGAFGIISRAKRVDVLLRALAAALTRCPRLRLVIAGPYWDDNTREELQALVATLNLSRHVTFTGDLRLADFLRAMRNCDVVVNLRYPSAGETSGSLHRALGLGKPVIVSDTPQFAEYPEGCCLRVPVGAGEVEQLTEALLRLAGDVEQRRRMGAAALALARSFSWRAVARQYLEILRTPRAAAERENSP